MRYLKRNILVAFIALLLNGIWEYVVCAYFYDNTSVSNMGKLMIEATAGDVAVTILFFNFIVMMRGDAKWVFDRYDYLNLSIYGIAAAFYFESKALNINRWAYSSAMPLLGESGIGVLPVFQFAILIPLTLLIEMVIMKKFNSQFVGG